jgi:hypothetical protein
MYFDEHITQNSTSAHQTSDFMDESSPSPPSHPRQLYLSHLTPFGFSLPPVDNSKTLQIVMQNTQHSFQIYGEAFQIPTIIENL